MQNDWEIPYKSISKLDCLCRGDNSTLYKGTLSGRTIAVKYVDAYEATKEIELLSRLKHENVVEIRGVCTKPPNFYILMEYCENSSLRDIIHSDYRIEKNDFFNWAKQIAEGMRYLHEHNIIHGNLKPANILVTDSYKLKISGFGSSRFLEKEESASMKLCGTAAYMAPEIVRNEPYFSKVDVWSFGIVAWEILCRKSPYEGLSEEDIIYAVASRKSTLPIPIGLPDSIRRLLEKCWSELPKDRPSFESILDVICGIESARDEEAELVGKEIERRSRERSLASSAIFERNIEKKIKRLVPSKNADSFVESVPQKWIVPYKSIKKLETIGYGFQGEVFKGILKREIIAVKMVQSKEDTEIGHLLRLEHKNLIKFYGICNEAPRYCVLMEYCAKGSLHQRIHHEIGSRYFIEWAPQIASGMCYLHEHNIIHRNLKPAKTTSTSSLDTDFSPYSSSPDDSSLDW